MDCTNSRAEQRKHKQSQSSHYHSLQQVQHGYMALLSLELSNCDIINFWPHFGSDSAFLHFSELVYPSESTIVSYLDLLKETIDKNFRGNQS